MSAEVDDRGVSRIDVEADLDAEYTHSQAVDEILDTLVLSFRPDHVGGWAYEFDRTTVQVSFGQMSEDRVGSVHLTFTTDDIVESVSTYNRLVRLLTKELEYAEV